MFRSFPIVAVAAVFAALSLPVSDASARSMTYDPATDRMIPVTESSAPRSARSVDPKFRRKEVDCDFKYSKGTIHVDQKSKFLHLVLGNGRCMRYGIGVGRPGFKWRGTHRITRKAEWPGWTPPAAMRKRQPGLPAYMPGGENNPLGARALYIGSTLYRIHGTTEPWTIGTNVSSGCIRLTNDDVTDLYSRVRTGARIIVTGY